jgi:hypothetical protein
VRLSASSPAALRQERAERLRRDRAATQTLRQAFPTVQQLRLELKFEGAETNVPAAQSHALHPPAQAFFAFPCPHADCDGQFDLTAAANAMLTNQAMAEAEGTLKCSGQRLDRRASRVPCELHLHYTLSVVYKDDVD